MNATSPLTSPDIPLTIPPESRRFYHPELDVLRFFAFFLVFLAHSSFAPVRPAWDNHPMLSNLLLAIHGAGFSGVCLFFALSSYLITGLLLKEQEAARTIRLPDFYLRRILRIWPLYFFFMLIVRPVASHFLANEHFSGTYLAAFLLLAGNWQCYFHGWPLSIAAPLWSISIEEQFYLAWPLLVQHLRRYIPAIALTMLLVANLTRAVLAFYPTGDPGVWSNTFTRLDPFALGALLAWSLQHRRVRLSAFLRTLLVSLGLVLLMIIGRFGQHVGPGGLFFYPIEALGCILLLAAVLRPIGSWLPGRIGKIFIYLGRISYGLYVYHLLFLTLVEQNPAKVSLTPVLRDAAALLLTIAAASLSYAVIESPFLRLKRRFTHIESRP
jgi:peptidoglycan/LPS O-acetylase OafA/YrhL